MCINHNYPRLGTLDLCRSSNSTVRGLSNELKCFLKSSCFRTGSISAAVKNLLPAIASDEKEERPPSPFPTIPDISQNPDILIEPDLEPPRRVETERPASPFPKIPDVNFESEIVVEDIEQFLKKEPVKSSLRPESPFPSIPDITLNPEIVEKDVTIMRTSPLPFIPLKTEIDEESKTEEQVTTSCLEDSAAIAAKSTTNPSNPQSQSPPAPTEPLTPFPDIPASFTQSKNGTPFFQPPLRKFEPVSLTGKKYTIKEPKFEVPSIRPEYNFALADTEYKVVERTYSEATVGNIRSLQSEIFESQGHFNASRSCSPFPVYIPLSREPTPVLKEPVNIENQYPPKADAEPDDMILMPHIESDAEKHLRQSTITGDETVSGVVKSQQKCFSELRDIQFCYAVAGGNVSEVAINDNSSCIRKEVATEENEIQKRLKEMKNIREGKCGDNIPQEIDVLGNANTSSLDNKAVGKLNERGSSITSDALANANTSSLDNGAVESLAQSDGPLTSAKPAENNLQPQCGKLKKKTEFIEEETKLPELMCKKPPDAIIGARPLFGQLDITSEFKKAIVGRSKSLQTKRSRSENKQVERSAAEPRIKIEKCENVETEDVTEDSKLSTQIKDSTKAEITKLCSNEHEEIEKIYFQQEREYEVDIQTTKEDFDLPSVLHNIRKPDQVEYFGPQSYAVADTHDAMTTQSSNLNGISRSSRMNANLNVSQENSQCQEYFDEDGEYRKVPVRSLIQNFEQCSMPAMRYKKIRDPLPDIVDKLSNSRRQSKENYYETSSTPQISYVSEKRAQDINLMKAEEEFDHLFYVANSCVRSQPYFPKLEIQNFQQSENSSFCRYSSHANLSQNVSQQDPSQAAGFSTQITSMEAVQQGKLHCTLLLRFMSNGVDSMLLPY